jgi:hypothetical protein
MTEPAPVAAPDATGADPELAALRDRNRGMGLTIQHSSIGGYRYKVIRGSTTRFVTDAADAQAVIDRDFL